MTCSRYRGVLSRKDLQSEVSAAVFAAKPPQVIKPIVTSKGVHLILVEEIIQPELDDNLHNTILAFLFDEWIQNQPLSIEVDKNIEQKLIIIIHSFTILKNS